MKFTQKIKLKNVTANDDAIMFKVEVNGEDRIFIGKQNTKFDISVEPNLEHYTKSDKLSANIKLAESFQKAYLVDKSVINKEDVKKDVIIPAAVSREIVQLGNSLYSLSKETNNRILYLLYKKRLLNRYEDEKTHMIFYDLDVDKIPVDTDTGALTIDENGVLKGSNINGKQYAGIINEFNRTVKKELELHEDPDNPDIVTGKRQIYSVENLENFKNYKNMKGHSEELEDYRNVVTTEDEMPFNLIYEYGEERQYESDASSVYADFVHMKNSLSPFFNVDVTDEKEFNLWRKYKKVDSSNFQLWTSYNLDTPKEVYEEPSGLSQLNAGNYIPYELKKLATKPYYANVNMFASGQITSPILSDNLNKQGFSIHVDTLNKELVNRFMFSYETRKYATINENENHLFRTPKQFAQTLIDNSNGSFYWKKSQATEAIYPEKVRYTVNYTIDEDDDQDLIDIECINDEGSTNELHVDLVPEYPYPYGIDLWSFNYDKGWMTRLGGTKIVNFGPRSNQFKVEGYECYDQKFDIIAWDAITDSNNPVDCYEGETFEMFDVDGGLVEVLDHKTVNNETPHSISLRSKDKHIERIRMTLKRIKLSDHLVDCFNKLRTEGATLKTSDGSISRVLKLSDSSIIFDKDSNITKASIKNANISKFPSGTVDVDQIEDVYTKFYDRNTKDEERLKFLLHLMVYNHGIMSTIETDIPAEKPLYYSFKNYELCVSNRSSTLEDAIGAFEFWRRDYSRIQKGDFIRFKNPRLARYEMFDRALDNLGEATYYGSVIGENDGVIHPTIQYFASPFDIRKAIVNSVESNQSSKYLEYTGAITEDPEMTAPNSDVQLIDLFGLTIGGMSIENREKYESNIVTYLRNAKGTKISVDLTVSYKDLDQKDQMVISLYINGQLVNNIEFTNDSDGTRNFLREAIGSLNDIRFWTYGYNIPTYEDVPDGVEKFVISMKTFPFMYRNISMWNYPISIQQIQALRRSVLARSDLSGIANEMFYIVGKSVYEITSLNETSDVNETYGKIFSMDGTVLKNRYLYKYDKDDPEKYDSVSAHNKKLYKVQDFDFVDRIDSLIKVSPTSGRKSNLYSVRLSNTGLVINEEDDTKTVAFKKEVNAMLNSAINTVCSKTEPINTKLFSVIIDS